MKTLIAVLCIFVAATGSGSADADPAKIKESGARAVELYPEANIPGTKHYRAISAEVERLEKESPGIFEDAKWPLKVAASCAAELGIAPTSAPTSSVSKFIRFTKDVKVKGATCQKGFIASVDYESDGVFMVTFEGFSYRVGRADAEIISAREAVADLCALRDGLSDDIDKIGYAQDRQSANGTFANSSTQFGGTMLDRPNGEQAQRDADRARRRHEKQLAEIEVRRARAANPQPSSGNSEQNADDIRGIKRQLGIGY